MTMHNYLIISGIALLLLTSTASVQQPPAPVVAAPIPTVIDRSAEVADLLARLERASSTISALEQRNKLLEAADKEWRGERDELRGAKEKLEAVSNRLALLERAAEQVPQPVLDNAGPPQVVYTSAGDCGSQGRRSSGRQFRPLRRLFGR